MTIENKAKYKKQNNFCSRLCKKEWKKFYSKLELNQITDNKRFWKTIKPLLSENCLQSFAIVLINNRNVISDDFKLAQIFNNYFKSAVEKLRTKECEASSDLNANSTIPHRNSETHLLRPFSMLFASMRQFLGTSFAVATLPISCNIE